jgi:hypothetical protein
MKVAEISRRVARGANRLALVLLVGALALECPVASAAPAIRALDEPGAVRDFTTLKPGEIATLPRTTLIKLPKTGRVVSLADLYKEHDARMARFAKAKTLGQAMLARLRGEPVALLTRAEVALRRPRPTNVATASPSPGPIGLSPAALQFHLTQYGPQLLPVETQDEASGTRYAKDYVDFCTEAKASACLYFPEDMEAEYPQANLAGLPYIFDQDVLVTPQQCADGYGFYSSANICFYTYPATSTVRWTETTPPSATITGTCLIGNNPQAPLDPYATTYDHYGVFQLGFQSEIVEPGSSDCIVQIKALPA